MRLFWIGLAIALGALTGLGAFTFVYAEGFSYFSTEAESCNNCHVMNEHYDGWRKSSHHQAAVCVDCHMPEGLGAKLVAKADNGYRHSKAFTFMDFHDPIMITPRNSEIVQANCVRCHSALVHNLVGVTQGNDAGVRCVQCHSHVGHGLRK
ncbi:MAG TPA: cytochrome c nitrite reductase small subunit [Planctomycetota bacterium]|nr:cytochrome c nitrite reductase small subunit [Planctomycetota bacterium]